MEKVGLLIKNFSLDSSFHGIGHLFGPRLFRSKILWSILSVISVSFWFYYLSLSLHEFFVERPTFTEIKLIHNSELTMPTVLVCPVLNNHSKIEEFFPGNIGPLFSYLLMLSQHPMMDTFRTMLSQNFSQAFKDFPNVEHHWSVLYNKQNIDENLARMFGKHQ